MAVKVYDETFVERILPEAREVGQKIRDAVEDETIRARSAERANSDAISSESARATSVERNLNERTIGIESRIPTTATPTNQLADMNFVNSSIEQTAANRVTYDLDGEGFPTRSALMNATRFYHGGRTYIPKDKDYALVISDENAPEPFKNGQTRFEYSGGKWVYAYGINDRPFTSAERAAIESGVTSQAVGEISTLKLNVSKLQQDLGDITPVYYEPEEEDWVDGIKV